MLVIDISPNRVSRVVIFLNIHCLYHVQFGLTSCAQPVFRRSSLPLEGQHGGATTSPPPMNRRELAHQRYGQRMSTLGTAEYVASFERQLLYRRRGRNGLSKRAIDRSCESSRSVSACKHQDRNVLYPSSGNAAVLQVRSENGDCVQPFS